MTTPTSIASRLPDWPKYASPRVILSQYTLRTLRPPEKLSVSEWAEAKRYLSAETNPNESGKWRNARVPYLPGIMDACSPDSPYDEVWIMKSSRSGVTTGLAENLIGYHMDIDACPILYAAPAKENASKFSRKNFVPMVRDTPALAGKIPAARSRDGNNTIFFKMFPGGLMQFAWSTSDKCFRGDTMRIVICDDVDAFSMNNKEGDPVSLAFRRSVTVSFKKNIAISNPTITGVSRIELGYSTSNQQHFYVPCPKCNHFQILVFGASSIFVKPTNGDLIGGLVTGYVNKETGEIGMGLIFDKDNCTWAYYICERCGAHIDEADKYGMLIRGEWRILNSAIASIAGFHISELYSTLSSTWLGICQDFLRKKKSAEGLQMWVNNTVGESFELNAYTISTHQLLERKENYRVCPMGVLMLTAGIDLQMDRIEIFVWGWGVGDEMWLIEHAVFFRFPQEEKAWQDLDSFLLKQFPHESGITLRIILGFFDSGNETQRVYKWTVPRMRRRPGAAWATKGSKKMDEALIPPRTKMKHYLMIGVSEGKGRFHKQLKIQEKGPLYVHLNEYATANVVNQFTSEKLVPKYTKQGNRLLQWILPAGKTNEGLDCAVLAIAAKELLRPNYTKIAEDIKKRVAAQKDKPPIPNSTNSMDSINSTEPSTGEPTPKRRSRIIRKGKYWKSSF